MLFHCDIGGNTVQQNIKANSNKFEQTSLISGSVLFWYNISAI